MAACERQLEELNRVSRRPFFAQRLRPGEIGRMVNDIRRLAVMVDPLPKVNVSSDPDDDFLLAVAETTDAAYLATGDKSDLLVLARHRSTRIVTARELVQLLER